MKKQASIRERNKKEAGNKKTQPPPPPSKKLHLKKRSLAECQPRRHGHAPRLRPVHEHRARRRRRRQDEAGHRDGGEKFFFSLNFRPPDTREKKLTLLFLSLLPFETSNIKLPTGHPRQLDRDDHGPGADCGYMKSGKVICSAQEKKKNCNKKIQKPVCFSSSSSSSASSSSSLSTLRLEANKERDKLMFVFCFVGLVFGA